MNALDYLEQAAAHADEGALGEPAARSILRIARQFADALDAIKHYIDTDEKQLAWEAANNALVEQVSA